MSLLRLDQAADSQDGSTKHLADLLPIVAEQAKGMVGIPSALRDGGLLIRLPFVYLVNAKATIPDALKEALMVRLRTFVENNVED